MTAAQNHPLHHRVHLATGVEPTPRQRRWLADLAHAYVSQDRAARIDVEPAVGSRYSLVVQLRRGRQHDYETATWTVSSAGTADIW
jgi:hypothetical protein